MLKPKEYLFIFLMAAIGAAVIMGIFPAFVLFCKLIGIYY